MDTPRDPSELAAETAPRQDPGRRPWVWAIYAGLYAASIPWYLPADQEPAIWLGLPYWVVLSLAATTAIAGFTVFVVSRHWAEPDEMPTEPGGHAR